MDDELNGEVITRESDDDPDDVCIEYRLPARRFLADVAAPDPWLARFVGLSVAEAKDRLREYWAELAASELLQLRDKILSQNSLVSLAVYGEFQGLCLSNDTPEQRDFFHWSPFLLPPPRKFEEYESQLDVFGVRRQPLFLELIRYFGGLKRNPFFLCDLLPPYAWDAFQCKWLRNGEPYAAWEGALCVYSVNGDTLLLNSKGETAWWFPSQETIVPAGSLGDFVLDYLVGDQLPQRP